MPKQKPDLTVANLGTMWRITATTDTGLSWVEEHVFLEPLFGTPRSFLADHRPARDIVLGAQADGLAVA